MTYDEYWNGDVWMVEAFSKADRLRRERFNQEAHLQGLYIYEALADVSPLFRPFTNAAKAIPYPNQPFNLFKRDKSEEEEGEDDRPVQTEEEKERILAKLYMNNMVRASKNQH
jgi:hypothetical protein